jgi:hypothetical protein
MAAAWRAVDGPWGRPMPIRGINRGRGAAAQDPPMLIQGISQAGDAVAML